MSVGRIAMEPAAELIVDAAVGHGVERSSSDRQRACITRRKVAAKQELDGHRLRELGRAAPAAIRRVESGLDRRGRGLEQAVRRVVASDFEMGLLHQSLDQSPASRLDLDALLAPGAFYAFEDLPERWHAVPRLVREVGPAVERAAVGRQEDGHRPAAAAGHRLDRRHVDLVEVRPLLAIDLDRRRSGR